MNGGEEYIRRARRVQGTVVAGVIAAFFVAGAFLALAWWVNDKQTDRDRRAAVAQATYARQARLDLCREIEKLKLIQREPLQDQVAQTRRYLEDTPPERLKQILDQFNTTRDQLERNLQRDERTLARLQRKDCR